MILKKKVTVIKNIRQTGGQNGLPGNYLINPSYDTAGKPTNESWFSSRDIRNSLLGNGLNARIPCLWLVGCTLVGELLTVEQSDIDAAKAAGKAGFEFKLRNRKDPVVYKTAGVHNINMELEMSNMSPEKLYQLSDLSMKHQRTLAPVAAAAPAAEEMINEDLDEEKLTDEEKLKLAEEAEKLKANENIEHEDITK